MTREELIAALENADGPSLVLDGEIWCARSGYRSMGWDGAGQRYELNGQMRHQSATDIRPFTTSIDAALTLVPDGWRLMLLAEWDHDTLRAIGPWQASLGPVGKVDCFDGRLHCDHAPTPALALCIVALNARS